MAPGGRLPGTAARSAQGSAGAPATTGWHTQGRALVASHRLMPIAATRVYALLAVAQYGAIVDLGEPGLADAEDNANGYGPGGRSRYEAERGAVAGASAQLLSFIFPDAAAALEQRVADEGTTGPGGVHPQFARGVETGRAMGNVMIAWAQADHFTDPWTGTIPTGSGKWIPNGAPAGPQIPAVRPYFMDSGDQFRPPAPPVFLSADYNAALAEVRSISDTRTPAQRAIAVFWAMGAGTSTGLGYFDELAASYIEDHGLGERDAAHILALANAAGMDAEIGCWDAKYTYYMIRPSQADNAITLAIAQPNHPSYPSGHTCVSTASSEVLAAFFPEHAADLDATVTEIGLSRIYGGIHYRFDIDAAHVLGHSVAQLALDVDRGPGLLARVR